MADFGGIVLILATSLGLYIVAILIKYFEQLWWTPNRIQKMMAAQGINGPAYKIVEGNSKEIYNMIQEARSKPLGLSHDIFPVVQPHLYVWIKKYGKIFLHWNGIRAKLVISDPDLAREVLTDKEKVYPKGANEGFLRKILGDGLTTSGGDKWERVRKIANHSFHGESLKAMTPATLASAEQMLDRWKAFNGKEIDVFKEFKFLTSEVISRTGFGSSYKEGEKIFEMFHQMALLYFRNTYKPRIPGISKFYKTPDEIESDRLEQGVREMIIELIRRKEKKAMLGEEDFESYFLGALVKAHHNKTEKVKISVDDLVDECKTFYFAAQETVNGTLAWTMLLLSLHPEWQEEARKEVLQVFGKQLPNADGLPKLKTMQMILHETLRLYSPVVYLERRAIREVKLGHITIPKNVDVVIPCVALHHEPQLWGNDAHLFKPERFAEGVAKATNNNIATYLPFGMGPRICVGSNFAQNELRIVLSMILQRYSFTLSPAYVHAPCRSTVVLPQHGVQVILHPL